MTMCRRTSNNKCLPRGVWYEEDKRRYRVRLYRNKQAFLKGYYPSLEKALAALKELEAELESIPRLPRSKRKQHGPTPIPKGGFAGTMSALLVRDLFNPGILKLKR